jgi:hypothetical protein
MTNLVYFQNRKGYFPAVSTGWVVSKEGFGIMIQNQLLKAKRKLGTKW